MQISLTHQELEQVIKTVNNKHAYRKTGMDWANWENAIELVEGGTLESLVTGEVGSDWVDHLMHWGDLEMGEVAFRGGLSLAAIMQRHYYLDSVKKAIVEHPSY